MGDTLPPLARVPLSGMRSVLCALLLATLVAAAACAPSPSTTRASRADAAPTDNQLDASVGAMSDAPTTADVQALAFRSEALGRPMPYSVYLPPDYATGTKRYPVLYMLHGMSGSNQEWSSYGLVDKADKMIRGGDLPPMIIVLPQGDKAYWVDHAGVDKEAWGRYMAKDVVTEVDAHFRTIADASHRAIGGVSMGAHGALQLAMNYPGTFTVVGAHSLVLRRYDTAPTYFGQPADFAKRDPVQLAPAKVDLLRSMDLWIDIGDKDPWAGLASQFDGELAQLKIPHTWHEWSGDHSGSYWSAHLADYLRFYGTSLSRRALARPAVALRPV
jgi:enterochelin esterase-like enzyme